MTKPSISVIIPALNEQNTLEDVVRGALTALARHFTAYEVLIVNDGSTDETGVIAERLSAENPNVRVFHNEGNKGLGYSLRRAYELATKDNVTWTSSDNGMVKESWDLLFEHVGKADLVIPYIRNSNFRSFIRRFLSRAYVLTLNAIFGLKIRYYNAAVVFPTELVRAAKTTSPEFAFMAESLILVLRAGCTYVEVPTDHQAPIGGKSSVWRLKNFLDVIKTIPKLAWDVYVSDARRIQLRVKETSEV